ncbi:hypothetical protein L4X63_09375 [Geomonas sp. Red32]|uniref:Mor transcription activator family protein n=1 Tax=Geomonas sp. Red32 TaxID=2912856 RepID=UPI00202CCE8E|nr:Mor transcription activator family protein [Geomonas sp. Red32]MCM0081799.1 hypothetical protein [Geomonas sp. Red32]
MKLVDCYPELLRDIYDKIEDLLQESQALSPDLDIAWETCEWIREHWSGRYLIRTWWGHGDAGPHDSESADLPGLAIQVDSLRTARGRELRDVIMGILFRISIGRPCDFAVAIAALVEAEWSTKKIYVPLAPEVDRAIKDHAIWQDFTGFSGIERVVAKHRICQAAIYNAFRRVQKAKKEHEEPPLPGLF